MERERAAEDAEPGRPAWEVDFLTWAVAEVERLNARALAAMDRQERFRIQNVAASIQVAANLYGIWLAENARLPAPERSGPGEQG